MGASWALWAATRLPDDVAAVSTFYGSQDIDFSPARASFQGHFAEHDEFDSDDDIAYLEAQLGIKFFKIALCRNFYLLRKSISTNLNSFFHYGFP